MSTTGTTNDIFNSSQEQVVDSIKQSQDAVVQAVRAWSKAVEQVSTALPRLSADQLPTPEEIVDTSFGFAERLLAAQREFAQNLLSASAPARREVQEAAAKGASKS